MPFRDVQSRGFINFLSPSFYTGIPLADLLLGLPSFTGGAQLDNPQYLRTTSVNLFVHENWRLRSNLTVNLGLRYEYNSPPADRFDHANLFDVETATLVGVGQQGIPRGGYEPDRNNFAPRIGLSWSPLTAGGPYCAPVMASIMTSPRWPSPTGFTSMRPSSLSISFSVGVFPFDAG